MMAAVNGSIPVDAQFTPPQALITQPLSMQSTLDVSDNDEEWEYEYSTTETEVRRDATTYMLFYRD
jgi:hypothetical protein